MISDDVKDLKIAYIFLTRENEAVNEKKGPKPLKIASLRVMKMSKKSQKPRFFC